MDATLDSAIDLMIRKKVRRLVVTEGEKLAGMLTERDILSVNRICGYCGQTIKPKLESRPDEEPDLFVECTCGGRYHLHCAKTIVYCLHCGTTVVSEVIYPEPSETMGG